MRAIRLNSDPGLLTIGALLAIIAIESHAAASVPDSHLYASYYLPDAIDYAGSIHVYLKNPTQKPVTVTNMDMDGKPIGKIWATDESFLGPKVRDEYIKVVNDQLAWYRVYPNPVPAGGVTEIVLRLLPKACQAPRHELNVAFADSNPLTTTVPMQSPTFALEYVGLEPDLDTVHVYVRTTPGSAVELSRVEIDGQPVDSQIRQAFSGISYAKVNLKKPWQHGSFHAVAAGTAGELRAVLIRALPTPAPLGIMGNASEGEIRQYADHLFGVNIAFTAVPAASYQRLAKYGLKGCYIYYRRLKPKQKKYEPVYYDDARVLAPIKQQPALWAYFLEDEPDGRYHVTSLPRESISRDVERANQFCRIFDPGHPVYLQMDHGGYPRNMYIYGGIPDYICTHAYALGTDAVVKKTRDHVLHTQAGSRPRPFYYLNCGYCRRGDGRLSEPDEMHLEVFTALAAGAKSLQWYPAHGKRGLLKHPKMWNAVGRMNGILHQVLPLVSVGMPVDQPRLDGGDLLGSTILCGDKVLVVVLVNKDFTATPRQFKIRPLSTTVSVRIPPFMKAAGVCTVDFPGPTQDISADVDGSCVKFSMNVVAGGMAVIYADKSVFQQIQRVHAACVKQFKATSEEP